MVIVQFRGSDNIGLVSLILLGWELRVLHCTMCTRHPDHVSLDFYAIPIFPFEEFLHLLVSSTNFLICLSYWCKYVAML